MEFGKKEKILVSIILGCVVILFGIFILKNSVFYDYEKSLNVFLVSYPENKDISKINNILERYQNNEIITNKINKLILDNIELWINNFNKDYNDIKDLDSSYNEIKDIIKDYLKESKDKVAKNHETEYYDLIERLYLSKKDYFSGLEYYQNEDYDKAYENFNKVIKIDSSFNLIPPLIDNCINNYLDKIYREIDIYAEQIDDNNKKDNLKKILDILNNYQDKGSIDLSISKSFNETKDNYLNRLQQVYEEELLKLVDSKKYVDAKNVLDEAGTYFTEDTFKTIREDINNHLPVNLIELPVASKSGWWVTGENIILQKGPYKDLESNVLVYNLNKEYKNLSFDIVSLSKIKKDNTYMYLKIYSDNKLIYTLDYFTYNSNKIKCNLNVSNTMELKIEAYYNIDSKSDMSLFNFLELENGILEKS